MIFYLIDCDLIESDYLIPSNPLFDANKFKDLAEESGLIYEFNFQEAFNNGEFNTENYFLYIENMKS